MPVYFDHMAHSIDGFVVHSSGWATITKFVTEIDMTALEFSKPVINSRLHGVLSPKVVRSRARSRARALQREVKARVQEFLNKSWSDLIEEIKPSHKAFWKVTKALKSDGYIPIPPLKRPDNSVALDDTELAECLADSIETQCSHASPPHDIAHINRIEEEVFHKTSLEPNDGLTPVSLSEVQTLVKSLNTRKASGLDGISNNQMLFSASVELTGRDF
ncbi:hypothetical protein EVAR_62722_1 [Eumeta japonica]|uniref:Uncharacterized protein n=1 Tax=Eumeta variegata TaxID=151549 RepID=A0A4C1Z5K7_EUMVA|nr:hypothetical protein EVAR_62722_1 [Eumeta japonica]